MNRTQFSEIIAKEYDFKAEDAKKILDFITDTIGDTLAKGEEVHIAGFGNFYLLDNKNGKDFRMPDGSMFHKEAFKAVKFSATGKLKDKVNHRNNESESE